jgi:hypothetical protein
MSDHKTMFSKIKEGMTVYDNTGAEVGTVEIVHFSEANGSENSTYAGAAAPPEEPARPDLTEVIGRLFGGDKLPDELRDRLLMHGFIKVDSAKLFGSDRYVMLDQIAKVENDGVFLKVRDDSDKVVKV